MSKLRLKQLAQDGATTGQAPVWNGTIWAPGDVAASGALIVTPESHGAVGDGTTDDTAAIQAAIDAVFTAGGGVVQFSARTYLVNATPRTDRGGNSILAFPTQTSTSIGGPTVILQGTWSMEQFNPADARGTVLKTTLTGRTYSSSYGPPSVIGGPTKETSTTSYMKVEIHDLAVLVPGNPTLAGIDLSRIVRVRVRGVNVLAQPSTDFIQPTVVHAFGIRMPGVSNYDLSLLESSMVGGMYVAYVANTEHFNAIDVTAKWCVIGFAPNSGTPNGWHASAIQKMSLEWCNYSVAGWTVTAGLANIDGPVYVTWDLLDVEDAPASLWYSHVNHIYDPTGQLRGNCQFIYASQVTAGVVTTGLVKNGGTNLRYLDLSAAPTTTQTVYYANDRSTAVAGQNTLTVDAALITNSLLVWKNGALLWPGVDYTLTGNVAVFGAALSGGDVIADYYACTTATPAAAVLTGPATSDPYGAAPFDASPYGI